MMPLLAISASVAVAAAVLWPVSARAFHALECSPNRTLIVDEDTGRRRCSEPSPDVQDVFLRSRQLQQDQERRTRALALQQRPPDSGQRIRELAIQRQQREAERELIEGVELAKQQQFNREQRAQALQLPLSLEQNANLQEALIRADAEDTRRRALVRSSELRRRQQAIAQRTNLPTVELIDELRVRQRQLEKQQHTP